MRVELVTELLSAPVAEPSSGLAPLDGLPALALLGLGALHGINPGMGWLFAVGLGLQRRSESAVWRALPPLALGHALAIAGALAVAVAAGEVIPLGLLRWSVGIVLGAFGLYRLLRTRHPRYGGMLVGFQELAIWSFLMASAHGAGLMVVPFVLNGSAGAATVHATVHASGTDGHAVHGPLLSGASADAGAAVAAAALHSLGYLLVAGLVAALVYRRFGLRILRTHWVNLDLLWAGALILTGALTVLL